MSSTYSTQQFKWNILTLYYVLVLYTKVNALYGPLLKNFLGMHNIH